MQKNNIRMIVQDRGEYAHQFASRLEGICDDICTEFKDKINVPPVIMVTSSPDGRQTATLHFFTNKVSDVKEAMFNGFHLRKAYDEFLEKYPTLVGEESEVLIEFLLKRTVE